MQYNRMSAQEAYTFVKSKRPIISPNLSFMGQLILFQQELISHWTTVARTHSNNIFTDVVVSHSSDSTEISTTKSTSSQQSLASNITTTSSSSQSLHYQLIERHAHESMMVSQLTDLLKRKPQSAQFRANPAPLLTNSDRCYSVPANNSALRNVFKRRRDELSLSFDLSSPQARKSPQISPCRVEAVTLDNKMTQSLNLSSTCT